jgi:predicted ATP-dependent endonuclease of OLD family
MKIASITVHNFRSIDEVTLNLGDYSLLVGENNSGKSNVIDSIRVFYEKGLKYQPGRDFPKFTTTDTESWIDIEFDLSDDEHASLKEEYKLSDNRLKVRKFLQTSQKGSDGRKLQGIHGYGVKGSIADEQFYGARNVQQGKLGDIIYVEDVSRLSEHTKMSGPSALRDLIDDIAKKLVGSSSSFQTLTREFEVFADTFRSEETADGASLDGLQADINAAIAPWDATFRLNISSPTETQIVKNLVSHAIEDRTLSAQLDPERFGQGFQRHLIFTLIRLAAQYQPPPRTSSKKEFSPQMSLILFEEPEAFLHPMQQRTLCQSLRTIAGQESDQVLASSHSPYFVSQQVDDIPSIIRLSREGGRTQRGQVSQETLQEIFAENLQINQILGGTKYKAQADDLKEDMEAVKYCLWLNPERCGLFFARHAILVEGATERVLINYLIATGQVTCPKGGVFVLDCLGKFNIHRFMNMLGALNVSHAVLFDADGEDPPHDKIRKLIEDSKNGHTTNIDAFPSDLESFLEIEKAGRPDRKPQHVMLKLHENAIKQERLDALIKKISCLIPTEGSE